MIPRDYITEWRAHAPWVQDFQVEQDLVISRALVAIFGHPLLRKSLAFRGGTALYKLHLKPAARYSEDIDLVQINAEPAGPIMGALREVLDPWLGRPQWKQTEGRVTFVYRFDSEDAPLVAGARCGLFLAFFSQCASSSKSRSLLNIMAAEFATRGRSCSPKGPRRHHRLSGRVSSSRSYLFRDGLEMRRLQGRRSRS